MTPLSDSRLREFVAETHWYHTIELAPGLVTKGTYDHRPFLSRYGFPADLHGWSVLDVGTCDGFFAFEFERRGSSSVVAIDSDTYDGSVGHTDVSPARYDTYRAKYERNTSVNERFGDVAAAFGLDVVNRRMIAGSLRRSSVTFRIQSVYELEQSGASYDLVFCGDLIEHLKHPLAALENLRAATRRACIISLSSALPAGARAATARRALRKILKMSGLERYLVEASEMVRYCGNEAGGAFFHFHPAAFQQAALASGFRSAEIVSEFDLPDLRSGAVNRHVMFHCIPR